MANLAGLVVGRDMCAAPDTTLLLSSAFRAVRVPRRVGPADALLTLRLLWEEGRVIVRLGALEPGLTCVRCTTI